MLPRSDVIDYKIYGDDMQHVEITLDQGETVVGEAGSMMYMENGIQYEAKMGDGSNPHQGFFDTIFDVGKRVLTKESLFMTHYTNHSKNRSKVGFASPYPGKILALDLKEYGGEVICQKDAFLCAARGTKLNIEFAKRLGAGLFGGEGFILQRLEGDGLAFAHAGGSIHLKKLSNETLRVDTGCIVGFTRGIHYDIEMVRGLKSMLFSGEGLFLANLSGEGYVWLQTLPFSRLADRVIAASNISTAGGQNKGEYHYFNRIINMLKS